jgi:hypothetical protein
MEEKKGKGENRMCLQLQQTSGAVWARFNILNLD